MTDHQYASLDIVDFWGDMNSHLVELVDVVPEANLNWHPSPETWSFFDIGLHIAYARHHWLTWSVKDGDTTPAQPDAKTAVTLKEALNVSWQRLARFLSDPVRLDERYYPPPHDPAYQDPERFDGHFIAFHRLVHDAHHRADMFHLLARLDVELPADRRRRPLL